MSNSKPFLKQCFCMLEPFCTLWRMFSLNSLKNESYCGITRKLGRWLLWSLQMYDIQPWSWFSTLQDLACMQLTTPCAFTFWNGRLENHVMCASVSASGPWYSNQNKNKCLLQSNCRCSNPEQLLRKRTLSPCSVKCCLQKIMSSAPKGTEPRSVQGRVQWKIEIRNLEMNWKRTSKNQIESESKMKSMDSYGTQSPQHSLCSWKWRKSAFLNCSWNSWKPQS